MQSLQSRISEANWESLENRTLSRRRRCNGAIDVMITLGINKRALVFLLLFFLDFLVFFQLHSSILKPNFDLSLRELQRVGNFNSSWSAKIPVKVKLFFKLQDLSVAVGLSFSRRVDKWLSV